jgi:fibronectin-binding autotransporter adhesin
MKPKSLLPQFRILATTSFFAMSMGAHAAVKTWTGTTDATWNTNANWGGAIPVTGDSLVFTSATGSGGLTLSDNLMTPGTFNVVGITFNAGSGAYVINPATAGTNGFTLTGPVTNNSTSLQTINDQISIAAVRTVTTATGGGDIALGGVISGAGGISKAGTGTLTLSGANTYTGTTLVTAGKLAISSTGSVGSTAGISAVNNATLEISGTYSLTSAAAMQNAGTTSLVDIKSGGIFNAGGSGGVTIGQNTTTTGTIDVSGTYTQTAGTLILGNAATTQAGNGIMNVKNGGLVTFGTGMVDSSAAMTPNGNGVALGRSSSAVGTAVSSGTINLETGGTIQTAKDIVRGTGNGYFNFNGGTLRAVADGTDTGILLDVTTTTVNGGGATIETNSGVTLTVADAMVAGSGSGGLIKKGSGTLNITGANTFAGATDIQAGTLKLDTGSTIANTSSITVGTNATLDATLASLTLTGAQTLQGKGQVTGTVITGANTSTIVPGGALSAGTLTLATLNAASGSTFNFELGTTSDQLVIGALTGSTAAGDLIFNLTGATGIATSTAYTLFTFTSQSGFDETDLAALTLPTGLSLDPSFGVGGWNIDDTNKTLQVQFIPEPASALLGSLGLLALLRRRRN